MAPSQLVKDGTVPLSHPRQIERGHVFADTVRQMTESYLRLVRPPPDAPTVIDDQIALDAMVASL